MLKAEKTEESPEGIMPAAVPGAWNTGEGGTAGAGHFCCIRTGANQAMRQGEVSRQREPGGRGEEGNGVWPEPHEGVGMEQAEARWPRASRTPPSTHREAHPGRTDRLVLPRDHRGGCVGICPKAPSSAGGSRLLGSDHRATGPVRDAPPGPPAAPALGEL